jgi:hypothetical protein
LRRKGRGKEQPEEVYVVYILRRMEFMDIRRMGEL